MGNAKTAIGFVTIQPASLIKVKLELPADLAKILPTLSTEMTSVLDAVQGVFLFAISEPFADCVPFKHILESASIDGIGFTIMLMVSLQPFSEVNIIEDCPVFNPFTTPDASTEAVAPCNDCHIPFTPSFFESNMLALTQTSDLPESVGGNKILTTNVESFGQIPLVVYLTR